MMDQRLIEMGYKEYTPPPFVSNNIEKCFQKRFDDEIGKRYFITVNKWNTLAGNIYEYETQFYKKDSRDAVNMTFHSSWGLSDVEEYLELLFETELFDYYEKWSDI